RQAPFPDSVRYDREEMGALCRVGFSRQRRSCPARQAHTYGRDFGWGTLKRRNRGIGRAHLRRHDRNFLKRRTRLAAACQRRLERFEPSDWNEPELLKRESG